MARIDPDDPRSPYHQIADDLRQAIARGDLKPSTRMKSSRELAAEYGVAAMTVHQAIRVLRDEGLVDSYQGRGVFVRAKDGSPRTSDLPGEVRSLGERVDELATRVGGGLEPELNDLRRRVGVLQAQLMELYARTGQVYPHDKESADTRTAGSRTRRRASGV
jgi:DNA-binding transcriptional regulator YhcF (GntR family)